MKRLIKILCIAVFFSCGFLALLLIVPLVSGKKILIGQVSGLQLAYGAIVMILLLAIFFVIAMYRFRNSVRNLIIMISVFAISSVALLGVSFFYLLFVAGSETYYTFYSPDKKYSVIAEEWSWLLAGRVTLYERINPFLVEKKADLITDDGFRAIAAEAYEIRWDDNVVTFTVETMDGYGSRETAVVEMELYK